MRTVLITGASAGLGAEFSRQFAGLGYNLVLVARRREKLDRLAEQIHSNTGVQITVLPADLADPAAPAAIYTELQTRQISIDYLINNAGIAGPDLLQSRNWQEHQDFYQLMMTSIAHLCHLLIPGMRERGFGRVINVASVAGRIARADGCNYSSSKAYVVALSESLSATLRGTGVNVCALCPGFTHTEFHDTAGLQEMKAGLPRWLWYSAETVVADGIKAVEKGKPVYLSGRIYRWIDPFLQSVWTRRLIRPPGR